MEGREFSRGVVGQPNNDEESGMAIIRRSGLHPAPKSFGKQAISQNWQHPLLLWWIEN